MRTRPRRAKQHPAGKAAAGRLIVVVVAAASWRTSVTGAKSDRLAGCEQQTRGSKADARVPSAHDHCSRSLVARERAVAADRRSRRFNRRRRVALLRARLGRQ